MSRKHPVVAVTGSSGAVTTTVRQAFENIFRREKIAAAMIEGDSFHSLDREAFSAAMAKAAVENNHSFSHFGPEANDFNKIEETFRMYGETGMCRRRYYLHSDVDVALKSKHFGVTDLKPGMFTPWEDIEANSDMLFYEGLHGLAQHEKIDPGKYVDFGIGVVPVVNLEWIQKIHRDKAERGYSAEATVDTILRRMPDYVRFITPQFTRTNINFQRVATVDTSDPFIARDIPALDESFVVVHFRNHKEVNFPHYLDKIQDSYMSRTNTLVVPGGKMIYAMEIILTPILRSIVENRR